MLVLPEYLLFLSPDETRSISDGKWTLTNTVDSGAVYAVGGIALGGTDPVAYFTQGKPVQGTFVYSHWHQGAAWYFSSAEHRDLFAANPDKYAPAYGGYCAHGMAQPLADELNYRFATVPEAWKIVDGRLYLNQSLEVREQWEADATGHIEAADANWAAMNSDAQN